MSIVDGFFDQLINRDLQQRLEGLGNRHLLKENLEGDEYAEDRKRRLIQAIGEVVSQKMENTNCNSVDDELRILTEIFSSLTSDQEFPYPRPISVLKGIFKDDVKIEECPQLGLRSTSLFTAGKGSPSLLTELRKELVSVDSLDILVSFITWSGVRKIADLLDKTSSLDAKGETSCKIRILTTTYTGATEAKAIDYLANMPGVELKISLDGRRTRLHAKAWIFKRRTGFGCAYVGSANLSGAAMTGGLEWTLKITQNGEPDVFEKAGAHFETLWNDLEFQTYEAGNAEHRRLLDEALTRESHRDTPIHYTPTWFTIEPKTYQLTILEQLKAERAHGRCRNLLVAATGTGKTCIAAFDYQQICQKLGGLPRLLFVAHRKEILIQARATFAQVLRQPDFGEFLFDGKTPQSYNHLFATIQTINSKNIIQTCGTDHWHMVIVDECHHSAAKGYDALLKDISPNILLGLTATPERGDGKSILRYFDQRPDGRPSAELRLWDALEQELLAPFEYYGCADDTDLSEVPWDKVGESKALDQIISGNHVRARLAIDALIKTVTNPNQVKALAFCVSVAHAQFMAEALNASGIKAEVIVGDQNVTPLEVRSKAPQRLSCGEVNVLCTCDLYNEGIDIPDVDTLLFLRPTQSPVVFQQQLGRGLRLAKGKESCVVIDLVGRFRNDFRADKILGIMTGLPRQRLIEELEKGFSHLPPGCHIQLDRISRERILETLKESCNNSWRNLAKELSAYVAMAGHSNDSLVNFLRDTGIELSDIYPPSSSTPRGWTALRRKAGLLITPQTIHEEKISSKISNLIQFNDPYLLKSLNKLAEKPDDPAVDTRSADILAAELFPAPKEPCTGEQLIQRLISEPHLCSEIQQLCTFLLDQSINTGTVLRCPFEWPISLHGRYGIRTIAIGTGKTKPNSRHFPREGVVRFQEDNIELLLITLDKTTGFKSSTSYHDYAISPELFHWQTQNSAGPETKAGRRYCPDEHEGMKFYLFVREDKDHLYCALGEGISIQAEGSKPMSITFRMVNKIPPFLFDRFSVLRAG